MLYLERMAKLTLVFHKQDLNRVNEFLAQSGLLHITSSNKASEFSEYDTTEVYNLIAEVESLFASVVEQSGLDAVYMKKSRRHNVDFDIVPNLEKIRKQLGDYLEHLKRLNQRKNEIYTELLDILYSIEFLEKIKHISLDVPSLQRISSRLSVFGRIAEEHIENMTQALQRFPHALFILPTPKIYGYKFKNVVITTDFENYSVVRQTAVAYGLKESSSQMFAPGAETIEDALASLSSQRWLLQEELVDIGLELNNLRADLSNILPELRYEIKVYTEIVAALAKAKNYENLMMWSGFLPKKKLSEFRREVNRRFSGQVELLIGEASTIPEDELPPTKYKNPFWIRPFELFVNTFGVPSYDEIDPTPAFFITFFVMFGIMFGDAGQGAVLFLIGLFLIAQKMKGLTSYGGIFVWAGLSSMICGFLFGSVFGKEDIIKPLLFNPMHNINTFLLIGVIIGVVVVSMGLILNFINLTRRREIFELIFGQWGVLSGVLYWLTLIFIVALLKNQVSSTLQYAYWFIAAALIMVIALKGLFSRGHEGVGIAESAFEVVDIVMSYFSNTVSFIRVAAFGLNHAALMIAVFEIGKLLPRSMGLMDQILGNLFVIILEGMIVTIQIMRLEFYEFFSKFYKGTGYLYRPYKIN